MVLLLVDVRHRGLTDHDLPGVPLPT